MYFVALFTGPVVIPSKFVVRYMPWSRKNRTTAKLWLYYRWHIVPNYEQDRVLSRLFGFGIPSRWACEVKSRSVKI